MMRVLVWVVFFGSLGLAVPASAQTIDLPVGTFAATTTPLRAIVKSGVRRVVHAAALLSSMSSIPSLNRTPWMTFASCRNPRSRRQDFSAHRPIL